MIAENQNSTSPVMLSYGRCVLRPEFFKRFYDIFLASHPAIRPMFAQTDFQSQMGLLKQGLNMALMYGQGMPFSVSVINRIRESHKREKLNIPPALYVYWQDSLMKTVAEFDPQFTPELEAQWRESLKPSLDHIKAGY